jgi:hypothetical protein
MFLYKSQRGELAMSGTFPVKIKHEFQSGFVGNWRLEDSLPNGEKLTPPPHPPTRLGVCSPSNLEDK